MVFGSLTEQEFNQIRSMLDKEKIPYHAGLDSSQIEKMDESMSNDLRHYQGASLSAGMLAIEVDDEDLTKLSNDGKRILENFGIHLEVPRHFFEGSSDENYLENKKKKVERSQKIMNILFGVTVLTSFFVYIYREFIK